MTKIIKTLGLEREVTHACRILNLIKISYKSAIFGLDSAF
jgi:hypothetical protein